jgi:hypothetical protein
MKTVVPTLAAVALVGMASIPLSAASIKDEAAGLSLSVKGQLQTRLTMFPEGRTSDVTPGGFPGSTTAGQPFWYQGGDPNRYAVAATSTTGAAGTTAVPYVTNTGTSWPPVVNSAALAAAPFIKNGESYDTNRGMAGEPEKFRFDVRRARLFFDATYGDGWKGSIWFIFDNPEANGFNSDRTIKLYRATAGKEIKSENFTQEIQAGYDAPFNIDYQSSAAYVLPTRAVTNDFMDDYRGAGIFYKMTGSMFNVGAAFLNNTNTSAPPGASSNGILSEGDKGNVFTLRFELSPSKAMKPAALRESYANAEGTHLMLGYDVQKEWGKQVAYTATQNYVVPGTGWGALTPYNPAALYYGPWYDQEVLNHGPDLVFHHKGLTTQLAYKYRLTEWSTNTDAMGAPIDPDDLHSDAFTWTTAYAIPVSDMLVEPAFRYTHVNLDRNRDEFSNYGRGLDYGAIASGFTPSPWASNRNDTNGSGDQFELGVTMYLSKTNPVSNKLQLSYLNWQAEEGVGKAQMFILQHQLLF